MNGPLSNHARIRTGLLRGAAIAVVSLLLVACSGSDGDGGSTAGASAPQVTLKTFQFSPKTLEVKTNTRVTWLNEDEILHTVTAGVPGQASGQFNGQLDGKGTSFNFTFSQPGTVQFFCDIHQNMRGEINVES